MPIMLERQLDRDRNTDAEPAWAAIERLLEEGDLDTAERLLGDAAIQEPEGVLWRLGVAWLLLARGKIAEALQEARSVAQLTEDSAAYRTVSVICLRLGKVQDAVEAAKHAFHLDPGRASRTVLAEARAQLRRVKDELVAKNKAAGPRRGEATRAVGSTAPHPAPKPRPATSAKGLEVIERESTFAAIRATTAVSRRPEAKAKAGDATVGAPAPAALRAPTPAALRAPTPAALRAPTPAALRLPTPALPLPGLVQVEELEGTFRSASDAQLEALFGGSLFGGWSESVAPKASPELALPRSSRLRRALIAAGVLVLLSGAAGLGRVASQRSARRARAAFVQRLQSLESASSLEQLAEALASRESRRLRADDRVAQGVARLGHVLLYRYHDADAARLRHLPEHDDESPTAEVTRALAMSVPERLERLRQLEAAAKARPKDPTTWFVLATALARAELWPAASAAMSRSLAIEPANVLHLALGADLAAQQGERRSANDRVSQAFDVSGSTPWARWAQSRIDASWPPATAVKSAAPMPADPPVVAVYRALLRLRTRNAWKDRNAATAELLAALDRVGRQPAFLLDVADELLQQQLLTGVDAVVALPTWPHGSPSAWALEARLRVAHGDTAGGRALMLAAFEAGARDPRLALAIARVPAPRRAKGTQLASVALRQAASEWPERGDLGLELADVLVREGDRSGARGVLEGLAKEPGGASDARVRQAAQRRLAELTTVSRRPARRR
jgi:tetratricopeptide (TPR) repeat protein